MVDRATSVLPDRLALGVRQFEQWRAQQDRRRRLPDHLWSLAVELAREFGVSRTAKTLRLAHNTPQTQEPSLSRAYGFRAWSFIVVSGVTDRHRLDPGRMYD